MSGVWQARPLRRVLVAEAEYAAILEHAAATPTLEVCGLLGGGREKVRSIYPVTNIADAPAIAFAMEPRAQILALKKMRARRERLLGIYHSHPLGPALPSARDLAEAAYPGIAYLIVSLAAGEAPLLASFLFDGLAFRPLPLVRIAAPQG